VKIYIPTIGRRNKQKSAEALLDSDIDFELVISNREPRPRKHFPYIRCPEKGIRATRQWIMDRARGKLIMLDDDLSFHIRSKDGKTFKICSPSQLKVMFRAIEEALDIYAHGGILERFMGQTQPRHMKSNSRYIHVLCYNKALFPTPMPKYRTEVGEDFEMNLHLLTLGRPNFVLTEYAAENIPYAPGGCNTWRTQGLELKETLKLEKLFPGLVRVVSDNPSEIEANWKEAAKMNLRTRINWKKAAQIGKENYPTRFPRLP
jgi:hypothetical protein